MEQEEKFAERAANDKSALEEAARVTDETCPAPVPPDVPPVPTPPLVAGSASLLSILESVVADLNEWPPEAFKAVLRRFGRMPRNGWAKAQDYFCTKFSVRVPLDEFQRRARTAVTTETGRPCSIRRFAETADKRRKTVTELFDENTLEDARRYARVEAALAKHIRDAARKGIEEAEFTRKIPSQKVDTAVLAALNRAAGAYAAENPPSTIEHIARILQAVQAVYQAETASERAPSPWRANIEAKIAKQKLAHGLLVKAQGGEALSDEERKKATQAMREQNLVLNKPHDVAEAVALLDNIVRAHEKRLTMHERRKEFRRQNQGFELNRRRFYRDLAGEKAEPHTVPASEIREFWSKMWVGPAEDAAPRDYSRYLLGYAAGPDTPTTFPSREEFGRLVQWLPCWKAAGVDKVYNYFIKNVSSLHDSLYQIIRGICLDGAACGDWFYKGVTYLIPKGTPKSGGDFRPITCMPCLYKLTTKCVTEVLRLEVERRGLLAENQLGAVRGVQGAKEQAMLNIAANREHGNGLKALWVDVKKAFDSVDHEYLLACVARLGLPEWVVRFLTATIGRWAIQIKDGRETILEKHVRRGILQGDTLSPLLFALCVDPLSRTLNGVYPMVEVRTGSSITHSVNHLLFVDDLKLLARDDSTLAAMARETREFFDTVGLEINRAKSATNSAVCAGMAELLDNAGGYKYLGVIEDRTGVPTRESYSKLKAELLLRVGRLCESQLNARNLIHGINEHAMSLLNYYVGVLRLEAGDFAELDHAVRQLLTKYAFHVQPACKERLYLPRAQLGRGLHSAEFRSEAMLLSLHDALRDGGVASTRRAAILHNEQEAKSHLALIRGYLAAKYHVAAEATTQQLTEAQQNTLYGEIRKKLVHQRLYRAAENSAVSVEDSALWLRKGNIAPREEAALCALQDRNLFMGAGGNCPHCGKAPKTVDHLATRCDRMLAHEYTRRHNEVVRCIHLHLCNRYGLKSSRKIRLHSVQEVVSNRDVEIRVDTRIKTDVKVQHDRPDIVVLDKRRKLATLIEIGITSQDQLQTVEATKARKYDLLAGEISQMYTAKIIPYVMTWDGVVTKCHKKYVRELELPSNVEAYIQSRVLRRTLEAVSFEARRGLLEEGDGERPELAAERLVQEATRGAQAQA